MEYLLIQNKDLKLTSNFNMNEFWDVKFGGHQDFQIPTCLIDGAQVLRNYLGAMQITSTIRPKDTFGFHRYLKATGAIDLIPMVDTLKGIERFKQECLNHQNGIESKMFEDLRKCGVEGFGLESGNCIHLDFRNGQNVVDIDQFGNYIVFSWDKINGSKVYTKLD